MTLLVRRGHGIFDRLSRFGACRSGNMAILFALMAVALMLSIGAAVDIGRWLHARDQTIAAVDAAVLAGGRTLQLTDKDEATAIAAAKKYYDQNVSTRLPIVDDTISFHVGTSGASMTATGSAYIKTPFLAFANITKLPLVGTSQTEFSKAELQIGGNGGENLEIALMLDVTGSMSGQKLKDLKAAATDLINVVIWNDQSKFTSKVALVPFSEDVRLPTTTALNKARGTGLPSTISPSGGGGGGFGGGGFGGGGGGTYYLSDCVVERIGTQKYTDAAPAAGQYVKAHYTDDSTGSGSNKKGVCAAPSSSTIVPLSSDKTALIAKVNGLTDGGGTAGQIGTAWAWYMLSPNWASLWDASSQPKPYGTAKLKKIAILMTDGEYNRQYDSNGISATESKAANGSSTNQARALCTAMKTAGVIIYTIGFDLGGNQTAIQTLNQCATDAGKVYTADNGDQLKQAYRDIALKLSSLYLSK